MTRPRSRHLPIRAVSSGPAARDIDSLYGLEPVFEPGREPEEALGLRATFHRVRCPYCGERFDTLVDVDPGTGAAVYIEDCQICCQPIEFELRVDSRGAFTGLSVRRS